MMSPHRQIKLTQIHDGRPLAVSTGKATGLRTVLSTGSIPSGMPFVNSAISSKQQDVSEVIRDANAVRTLANCFNFFIQCSQRGSSLGRSVPRHCNPGFCHLGWRTLLSFRLFCTRGLGLGLALFSLRLLVALSLGGLRLKVLLAVTRVTAVTAAAVTIGFAT